MVETELKFFWKGSRANHGFEFPPSTPILMLGMSFLFFRFLAGGRESNPTLKLFSEGIRLRWHIFKILHFYKLLARAPPALKHFSALFQISGICSPALVLLESGLRSPRGQTEGKQNLGQATPLKVSGMRRQLRV